MTTAHRRLRARACAAATTLLAVARRVTLPTVVVLVSLPAIVLGTAYASPSAATPALQRFLDASASKTPKAHSPHSAAGRQLAFAESELGAALAPTPYMGWESWFALGTEIDEATALEQASQLVQLGLQKLGYDYVWLDAGWWQGERTGKGAIAVSRAQWPRGIAGVAETLHSAGMKLGVYTDAGREGCNDGRAGSYRHYKQDVDTFASWGVDAIKVDFCGGSQQKLDPKKAYTQFHEAIVHDRPHRPMLLEVCDFLQAGSLGNGHPSVAESSWGSYAFGPEIGNSWRTETDIGSPGHVRFPSVLRNLDADATHPEAAGPGHWNEPDYLVPEEGLNNAQLRTQVSMWAILAAPMMISANLQTLSKRSLEALTNQEVIDVDQDPAGVQGTLVAASGEGQVWSRPLSDGSFAVALLNRAKGSLPIETSTAAVGLPTSTTYEVRNLWTHTTSSSTGTLAATVPSDSTVLLRVSVVRAGATAAGGASS